MIKWNLSIRRSFSTKLSLWILLLTVPVFFASVGLLFRQSHRMIYAESVERANGALIVSMQHFNRYLTSIESVTNTYGWIIESSMCPDSLTVLTDRIVRLNPYTDGCAICTEPGVMPQYPRQFMVYSYRMEGDTVLTSIIGNDYDYFNEEWYKMPMSLQKAVWGIEYDESNQLDMNTNNMIASYSKPLYGADSTMIGVISTDLSLIHLSKILAEEKPYPHSYFFLIDEKGRYIGHPDSTKLFNKTIFNVDDPKTQTDLIALGYEMTKGKQGNMPVNINGNPSVVCFKPVPGTTWSMAIVCSDSDILKGYNRFTYIVLTLLIIGLFLIVLYCHKIVARSLRPLRRLLSKTQEIAKGNMDVQIEHSSLIDNIGSLQNSYVTMLESLREYTDSVYAASDEAQRYNEELEQATQLVVEADKQKTAFIQNMTHQLRTPLNVIMGYVQILNIPTAGNGVSEEEIKSLATSMDHNSKLLNRMVLMLIDSSNTSMSEADLQHRYEPVGANTAMKEMVDYVESLYPNIHIGFTSEVPDDLIIKTSKKYLQYCLAEVLLNAVKYSDREHIKARVLLTEKTVRFVIEDTGKGISEADRERIFKFFMKVDDFSEGLGLGLPLTKRHAQELGGDFMLDPTYHEGCRFIFELPL